LTGSRIPLSRAHQLASTVIREARRAGLPADGVITLGSLRRWAPDVGDVSLLAVAQPANHDDVLDGFLRLPPVTAVLAKLPSCAEAAFGRGRVRLYVSAPEDAGAALLWHTGARRHTDQLQRRAALLGLVLRDGLLSRANGALISVPTEEDVYRHLRLPYISPELREGADEIEIAARGDLPVLVSSKDIRGDLHMHSTWSDGRDSIQHMVLASKQLGYEYVAITDHSERCEASRKLLALEIPIQREEIDGLRSRIRDIEILHGIEVDIMSDGSLDFDDDQLAGFDIVLASLHGGHGCDGRELTERYLRAMRHPMVNVITHPANRTPAMSKGYDLDYDRLFEAAVLTGTAMEVDGAPGHLDMDGEIARRAVAAGVTVAIDSDCHRAEDLERQMRYGLGTARRGWVQPTHVLNARSADEVRAFVARKRAGA
jgi:DNA polymerase (family 10)